MASLSVETVPRAVVRCDSCNLNQFEPVNHLCRRCGSAKLKPSTTLDYPHRLRWDRMGRQGQSCRILRARGEMVQVEFEDGLTALLSRKAIVRKS